MHLTTRVVREDRAAVSPVEKLDTGSWTAQRSTVEIRGLLIGPGRILQAESSVTDVRSRVIMPETVRIGVWGKEALGDLGLLDTRGSPPEDQLNQEAAL
jgi:hypothetical protein